MGRAAARARLGWGYRYAMLVARDALDRRVCERTRAERAPGARPTAGTRTLRHDRRHVHTNISRLAMPKEQREAAIGGRTGARRSLI